MAKRKKKVSPAKRRAQWLANLQMGVVTSFRITMRLLPIATLGALFLLGFLRVREALYTDSALVVRQILVAPAGFLPADLKSELDQQWVGSNIFLVDVKKVSSLLVKDPSVLKADTVKKFPATLEVQITPRIPFARVTCTQGGSAAVISEDGVILNFLDSKSEYRGPSLDAFESDCKAPVKGKHLSLKGLEQAVAFYHQFQYHPLSESETITRLSLDYLGNLTITLGSSPEVKLGRKPLEILKDFHQLKPLLDPVERSKIQYVDLQFEDVLVKKRKR